MLMAIINIKKLLVFFVFFYKPVNLMRLCVTNTVLIQDVPGHIKMEKLNLNIS